MQELIKITHNQKGERLVSARELHEFLESKERFSKWFGRMIEYAFIENEDFTSVQKSTSVNNGAKINITDYAITIDMAKELSMLARNIKGKQARKYFIECEKKLKTVLPGNYKEALLALVAAEEEKEKLLAENDHKQEVINGLTCSISVATKRDIVNRVVRWGKASYSQRYNELYLAFKNTHHIDLKARCEGYNHKQTKKKDKVSVIKYAEKMGYINDLYDIACRLYESDVNDIKIHLGLIM